MPFYLPKTTLVQNNCLQFGLERVHIGKMKISKQICTYLNLFKLRTLLQKPKIKKKSSQKQKQHCKNFEI